MSRIKFVLLGLLAMFAVSGFASASASAEPTKPCGSGNEWVFCYHTGLEIHEELVLGLSGLSILTGKIGTSEVRIDCLDDHVHGVLELLGKNKGEITFLNCKLEKPAGCKLSNAEETKIVSKVNSQLIGHPGPAQILFSEQGAGPFAVIEIANAGTCPPGVPGNYNVTGEQKCELPSWETFALLHEVVCTKALSVLKLGVEKATFSSTAKLWLESDLAWGVRLGS
jgi:hypothetical protein